MARVAHREGYPEIGLYWEKAAYEEAEHAAKFAELLGEVVTPSTEENLKLRVAAEHGATQGKKDLAKMAKEQNLEWMKVLQRLWMIYFLRYSKIFPQIKKGRYPQEAIL